MGRRLPIRLKLTLAFAVVMALALSATGLFIYLRLGNDLDATLNQGLRSRAADVQALVRQAFKPEFVNRLDDIVVFQALTREDLAQIVSLYVDRLARRIGDRRLELAVTPDARAWLSEKGYDPIYGARPLRRLMQHEIDDRLATEILRGTVRDGDTVRVDLDDAGEALTVTPEANNA